MGVNRIKAEATTAASIKHEAVALQLRCTTLMYRKVTVVVFKKSIVLYCHWKFYSSVTDHWLAKQFKYHNYLYYVL